jgi:hypothetical protein
LGPAITGSRSILAGPDRPVVTLIGVIHADHPGSDRFLRRLISEADLDALCGSFVVARREAVYARDDDHPGTFIAAHGEAAA